MKELKAKQAISAGCTLGEGPVWFEDAFWWVDIEAMHLHRWSGTGEGIKSHVFPERIGFAVPARDGTWRVGLQSGIHAFDPATGDLQRVQDPEPDLPDNRFNDGKCDPAGRLWAGTMSTRGQKQTGSLYRITGGDCERVITGVTVSNGLAWDLEREKMYYIDTPTREVAVFNYNLETGEISNRRAAYRVPDGEGSPDGMTIDTEGNLWIALWGGHGVLHIDPATGDPLSRIEVPAPNVTSCTFGGQDWQTLYITTARAGMSQEQLEAFPQAGDVFAAKTGSRGSGVDCFHP